MKLLAPEWHERLTSTNSVLAERVRHGDALPHGFVLAARAQTAGRGRGGRAWVAPPGEGLTFSFVFAEQVPLPQLVSLPMAAALGVAEWLDTHGVAARVKWPNDVLVDGRKICGILAERVADCVVVGVGINVNMSTAACAGIDRPATSLRAATGTEHDIPGTLAALAPHLERRLADWQAGGFAALAPVWEARCHCLGCEITVGDGDATQRGVLAGFGPDGQLRLRHPDGREVDVWAGDMDV